MSVGTVVSRLQLLLVTWPLHKKHRHRINYCWWNSYITSRTNQCTPTTVTVYSTDRAVTWPHQFLWISGSVTTCAIYIRGPSSLDLAHPVEPTVAITSPAGALPWRRKLTRSHNIRHGFTQVLFILLMLVSDRILWIEWCYPKWPPLSGKVW